MSLDDFLKTLTPEQKEQLKTVLEESPIEAKPKRKQRRTKKSVEKRSGKIKKIGKATGKTGKGKQIRRVETVSTQPQENLFKTNRSSLITDTEFRQGKAKDNRDDALLFGSNELTERGEERISYANAKCTKCDFFFENVPSNRCYRDDNEFVFICDNCLGRR